MKATKNSLEWSVFGVSALILAALVVYLAWNATQPSASQPVLQVTTGSAEQRGELWSVPVTIENSSDQTAEGVRVEIALLRDATEVEVAEVSVSFVPRHSMRRAWAMFRTDPRGLEIVARGMAFRKP